MRNPVDEDCVEAAALAMLPELVDAFGDMRAGLDEELVDAFDQWMVAHAAMYYHLEGQENGGRRRGRVPDDRCRGDIDPYHSVFNDVREAMGAEAAASDGDLRDFLSGMTHTTTTIHVNTSRYR